METITVPELEVVIRDEAAEAVETLMQITGKSEPVEIIISALRIYEWILAQQAKGKTLIVKSSTDVSKEDIPRLANYVKNYEQALQYFKGRDIFEK
jgi:hypothetical protein